MSALTSSESTKNHLIIFKLLNSYHFFYWVKDTIYYNERLECIPFINDFWNIIFAKYKISYNILHRIQKFPDICVAGDILFQQQFFLQYTITCGTEISTFYLDRFAQRSSCFHINVSWAEYCTDVTTVNYIKLQRVYE